MRIADPNANTNSHANGNADGDSNSYAYTDSYADCHSDRYAHADSDANCDGDSYADCDGNANRHLPGNLYDGYYHWHHNRGRHGYRQPLRRLHYAGESTLPSKRIRQSADFSGVCRVEWHATVRDRAPTQAVLLHVVHPGGPDSRWSVPKYLVPVL